jgi:type I restriction enzyme S subunit
LHAQGIVLRDTVPGADIKTKKQQVCCAGEFLVAEIDAKMGGFGLIPDFLEGAVVSSHYFLFEIDESQLDKHYLDHYCCTALFRNQVEAQGSTNYAAIRPADVLSYTIPLPSLPEQQAIIARLNALAEKTCQVEAHLEAADADANAMILALHRQMADSRIVPLSKIIELHEETELIQADREYPQVGVRSFAGGLFAKPAITGAETSYKTFNRLYENAFVLSQVKGWEGAIALTPSNLVGMFSSPEYRTFRCLPVGASPQYLVEIFKQPWFWSLLQGATHGVGARRERIRPEQFLNIVLPMPKYDKQTEAAKIFKRLATLKARHAAIRAANAALLPATLERIFTSGVPTHA